MTFGYNSNSKDLIQKYEVLEKNIIITLLDGSIRETDYTEFNEKGILGLMRKQAVERMESYDLKRRNFIKSINDDNGRKLEELEKYKLYLQNEEKFEKISADILFQNVEKKSDYININNLDLYSYKEIKTIYKNILKYLKEEIEKCAATVNDNRFKRRKINDIMDEIEDKKKKRC